MYKNDKQPLSNTQTKTPKKACKRYQTFFE